MLATAAALGSPAAAWGSGGPATAATAGGATVTTSAGATRGPAVAPGRAERADADGAGDGAAVAVWVAGEAAFLLLGTSALQRWTRRRARRRAAASNGNGGEQGPVRIRL